LIAITMGDPSGIGPEVVAGALQKRDLYSGMWPFVMGTVKDMRKALKVVGSGDEVRAIESPDEVKGEPGVIEVLSAGGFEDTEFPVGQLSADSGAASHNWVETAATMCLAGDIAAMVTAPVNKEAWQISGSPDLGHQEVFKRLTNAQTVYTMLVSGDLRCMHLSTHKPLIEACKFVTTENILTATRITHDAFTDWGFESPRIAVAALNPHASDNGLIGDTEAKEIRPAVEAAMAEGINATGFQPGTERRFRCGSGHVSRSGTHCHQGARIRREHQRQPWNTFHTYICRPWHCVRHSGAEQSRRHEHG